MRVLLTGGAGFIGSHVADRLVGEGHEVLVVDDLSRGRRENVPDVAAFREADFRECGEVFRDFGPEAVCHQAAQIDVRYSVTYPIPDLEINTEGTLRLLESCVEHGVGHFVFASTGGAIYGEQREFPAGEEHPQLPVSPYGISKMAAEHYLSFFGARYGLHYTALRYANVYGPRQDPRSEAGVVAIFAGSMMAGEACKINGSGEQTRDYVYVEDVARANALALARDFPSGAYNIGTGTETSVNELHAVMSSIAGRQCEPEYGPAKPGEQLRSSVDPRKAARTLGWRPEFGLSEGLGRTLSFFGAA